MDSWHLVLAVLAGAGWASLAAFIVSHREVFAIYERNNEKDTQEVAHLRKLLALRDAPKEEQWMSAEDFPPQFPETARYDESGLFYVIEEDDGNKL